MADDYTFIKDDAGMVFMLQNTVAPAVQAIAQEKADEVRGYGFDVTVKASSGGDRCAYDYGFTKTVNTRDRSQWHTVGGKHRLRILDELAEAKKVMKGSL